MNPNPQEDVYTSDWIRIVILFSLLAIGLLSSAVGLWFYTEKSLKGGAIITYGIALYLAPLLLGWVDIEMIKFPLYKTLFTFVGAQHGDTGGAWIAAFTLGFWFLCLTVYVATALLSLPKIYKNIVHVSKISRGL